MSAWEFNMWLARYERSPWDEERADLRAGIICATTASALGGKKLRPSDFMPEFGPPKPLPTEDELKDKTLRVCAQLGGRIIPALPPPPEPHHGHE
jgi:hypothetical protein